MATGRASEDAMHTSLPGSPPLSSNVGSPNGSGHDVDGMGTRSGNTMDEKLDAVSQILYTSKRRSLKSLLLRIGCPVWIHISRRHVRILRPVSQRCARSRHMQHQHQMYPFRHDLGIHSDIVTAPQPLGLSGPMALGHLMTTETHDEGLILPQAPRINNHEAPSCFDSLANSTSEELQSGSIPFGKDPRCLRATNLSEFIAKQVPCQSGLFLKHEANAKTSLLDIKMMVSLMQLTVPSAASIQLSLSANPNQLKTERLENNLRLCAEDWLTNLKFSSLMEMTKVQLSSQRSMLAPKSSASKIKETELENRCSNLLRLVTDKRLHLLHLICLFLVFRLKCCNGFSLKPTSLMCDGRSLASPLCCRPAGRGALFCGLPFRWICSI